MVYFLALLGVAFGAVSLLVYRSTRETLREKQKATQDLIEAQYRENCEKEKAHQDFVLLSQARNLAGWLIYQNDTERWRAFQLEGSIVRNRVHRILPLAALGGATSSYGLAVVPICAIQGISHPLGLNPAQPKVISGIDVDKNELAHVGENLAPYIQIDHAWGGTYRSEALGSRSMPLDPTQWSSDTTVDWRYDVVELDPGVEVRRVVLRMTPPRWRFTPGDQARNRPPPPPPQGSGGPGERGRGDRPRDPAMDFPRPALFIQCAIDVATRDKALESFQSQRDDELAQLEDRTAASLAGLRNHLLGISVITFVATVLGGVWLVRAGLSPLRRLSVAVSRVSPKDFRLPFEDGRLPNELQPIVARLSETLDMLKRAFAREKQAAADISHELRTPLAALLTTIDVTLRKPRSSDTYREALEECRSSGQTMNVLVERLLALARLDAGVDMLRPQSVDASELAEQCASLVRPLAEARGLHLHVHRNGPAVLQADPAKLREVVTNLLHNAIQYNRPDGSVDLSVARRNGDLEVEVADTGIGISKEAKQHIFERFYRADPSRSADGLHAGLGLAIVKGYVDLMGGTIAVESTEGKGSKFRVRLPVGGAV
jgi:heavy metal sensor kinase